MYISEVWVHIVAYMNKAENDAKWQFEMMRTICYNIHRHSMIEKPEKSIERFMPSPWSEKKEGARIARTPQEVWDDYEKRKQAKANKDG